MAKKDYSKRVALPQPHQMNGGLNFPSVDFMVNLLGKPRTKMTDDCAGVTNKDLNALMSHGFDVGSFKVSGLTKACESLKRIFDKVREEEPELYQQIGTAGMLCVRNIRGTTGFNPSNHSWGGAIDVTINGKLDERGDAKCQEGLLILYRYFHEEGWFWGAEYRGPFEDSMHFEVARETLQKWYGHSKGQSRKAPLLLLNGVIIRDAYSVKDERGRISWYAFEGPVLNVLGKASRTPDVAQPIGDLIARVGYKVVKTSNRLAERNRFDIRVEKA